MKKNTSQVWDEVFNRLDLSYSEEKNTQARLFEMVKIGFLKNLFPKGKLKMLEVGCGTAFVSLYFSKRGYQATCLDINASVLKAAKKNFQKQKVKGKFLVGDAQKLPFKDNSFDIVCSFGLLEHFKNPDISIKEMVRVLKPKGLFFADIVPARFSCQTIGNFFNFLVTLGFWSLKAKPRLAWKRAMRNFVPLYFENSFSIKKYQEMMAKAGISDIQIRGNRPFPRLTLPLFLDKLYTGVLKLFLPLWKIFDSHDNPFSRFFGAGLWFWGYK